MAQSVSKRIASLRPPLAPEDEHGCFIYQGPLDKDGYGKILYKRRHRRAHAVAWEVLHGRPMPPGKIGLHKCPGGGTRRCTNGAHVSPGTHAENMTDKVAVGHQVRGERQALSKLTAETVREIRERYALGNITLAELGREFGVVKGTIHAVVTRRTWMHLNP